MVTHSFWLKYVPDVQGSVTGTAWFCGGPMAIGLGICNMTFGQPLRKNYDSEHKIHWAMEKECKEYKTSNATETQMDTGMISTYTRNNYWNKSRYWNIVDIKK